MPFIGTQPEVGGYSVLDALTASATASYTLQKDSANFVPSSANQLLVSLNGVIQKPGSSFTVSGSTLTFSSALDSSDSIDFIISMGEPLLVGTPSDGAVNTTQLATNAVSSAKIASSAVTDVKVASGVSASKLTTGTLPHLQLPAGSVLQTLQGSKTDTSAISSTSFTDIGLSVSITPKSTSSKILVKVILFGYAGHYVGKSRVMRDSTELGRAASANNRPAEALPFSQPPDLDGAMMGISTEILDSPSTTSAITYKIQTACRADGTQATYINRSESDRDTTSYDPRTVSYITVMEIAG